MNQTKYANYVPYVSPYATVETENKQSKKGATIGAGLVLTGALFLAQPSMPAFAAKQAHTLVTNPEEFLPQLKEGVLQMAVTNPISKSTLEVVAPKLDLDELKKKNEAAIQEREEGNDTSAVAEAEKDAPKLEAKTQEQEKAEQPTKEKKEKSEDYVFSEETVGSQFYSKNKKPLVGSLTVEEAAKVKNEKIRPVSPNNFTSISSTVEVVEKDGKKSFNHSVTYEGQAATFAPSEGVVHSIEKDKIAIKHTFDGLVSYSILSGEGFATNENLKKGDKVQQGTIVGSTTKNTKFSIATNYDKETGEYFEYLHPNRFVDMENSNNFPYGNADYYTKDEVKVDENAVSKDITKVPEEVLESDTLKGVVIENDNQFSVLESKDFMYRSDRLPAELIQGGKANVLPQVRELEPEVREAAMNYGIGNYTEFLLALLQKESGGLPSILAADAFQSSESKYGKPNVITDPAESIDQGVKVFAESLKKYNMNNPLAHNDIRYVIQNYNYGNSLYNSVIEKEIGYSLKAVQEVSAENTKKHGYPKTSKNAWRGDAIYGDFTYVHKIFNLFEPAKDWEEQANAKKTEAEAKLKEENAIQVKKEVEAAEQEKAAKEKAAKEQKAKEKELEKMKEILADTGNGRFGNPMELGKYRASSKFGMRPNPTSSGQGQHDGIDYASDDNAKIYAMEEGEVMFARAADGYGMWVVIRHTGAMEGYYTIYGHMYSDDIFVKEGQKVIRGELIALAGNNSTGGQSTGTHLHFGVADSFNPKTGRFTHVDPAQFNYYIDASTSHIDNYDSSTKISYEETKEKAHKVAEEAKKEETKEKAPSEEKSSDEKSSESDKQEKNNADEKKPLDTDEKSTDSTQSEKSSELKEKENQPSDDTDKEAVKNDDASTDTSNETPPSDDKADKTADDTSSETTDTEASETDSEENDSDPISDFLERVFN